MVLDSRDVFLDLGDTPLNLGDTISEIRFGLLSYRWQCIFPNVFNFCICFMYMYSTPIST